MWSITEKTKVAGRVERRLLSSYHYERALQAMLTGDNAIAAWWLEKASKPMFRSNNVWKLIKSVFNVDLQIPLLTGYWTLNPIADNLVTTRGKRVVADQLGGTTTAPVTAIALGIGATAAAAGNTALESEITTNGGARGAATITNTTTTTTGDTEQWVRSFTFSGSFAVTEEGLLDNNASGGNLLARQVFSAINVQSGDILQITHKEQVT